FDERQTLILPPTVPPATDEQPTLALQEDDTVGEPQRIVEPLGPPQLADYEILRELGRGGMGVVYQARQKSLQLLVALKMILAGSHARAEDRERFQTEAQAIARLQHPNIVRIHEVGEAEGRPFLSLEYVDGGSLAHRLNGTPLPPRQAARLVAVMARAVEAAHQQGLVHRDLKPSNILLQRKSEIPNPKSEIPDPRSDGEGAGAGSDFGFRISDFDPKITDFGLAKELENDSAHSR